MVMITKIKFVLCCLRVGKLPSESAEIPHLQAPYFLGVLIPVLLRIFTFSPE